MGGYILYIGTILGRRKNRYGWGGGGGEGANLEVGLGGKGGGGGWVSATPAQQPTANHPAEQT